MKKSQVEISQNLFTNASIEKLNNACLLQANLNVNQILEGRNTTLSQMDIALRKKQKSFNNFNSPWLVEIIQRGAMFDALVEIWCIQMIPRAYSEVEAINNQVNYKRFDLLGKTIPWMNLTFPCWTESIIEQKKGNKRIKFEAKLRIPNNDGVLDKSLLGIYECNSKGTCKMCETLQRKCTLTSPVSLPLDNDSQFYSNYAQNSNNEIHRTQIGLIRTQLGDYCVEVVYFNDKIHNNMMAKSFKTPPINLTKTPETNTENKTVLNPAERIIMDYQPTSQKKPISISPTQTKPMSPSTSPIPVHNPIKPTLQSDHGKSAPMNIQAEQHSVTRRELNSPPNKASFSFDKDVQDLFANSPQGKSISDTSNSSLWRKRANSDLARGDEKEEYQPASPRRFEKRRSRKSGSSSVLNSAEESQFLLESADAAAVTNDAERNLKYQKDFEDV